MAQPDYAESSEGVECPTCGCVDPPEVPGHHLCSGMRPLTAEERKAIEWTPEARAELEAKLKEFDRCRSRAAVDARSAWIG